MIELPTIQGIIKRRILANYRADASVVRGLLPSRFEPKLHKDHAIVGICLIRLEGIRPLHTPKFIGLSSENAAHRIAVTWTDDDGHGREGVFIPRRDTNSGLNHLAGGRVFPGEHNLAKFAVADDGNNIDFAMTSEDGKVSVNLKAISTDKLTPGSIFDSVSAASQYFEGGSLGYSVTRDPAKLDGIILDTKQWHVEPLNVQEVRSTFYDDPASFPEGSIEFDHALIMRDIAHEWHSHDPLTV
ncbi:MAG: DUF2071 domain-containing protein [bacterium]|nr:DUF2071 domain-containing protein [bacterium]